VLERHGPAVLRFCVARLGCDRGEEPFRETIPAALRHYDELRDTRGGRRLAVLNRAAQNPRHRTQSRRERPARGARLGWHDPNPADSVWSQVAALPPKQREAVAHGYMADLSHGDIAAAMGTTVDAARRSVYEGLQRLTRDLADDPDNP
jgi:DNA-directed RNA polymerase specialized sigma24 family protein